MHSLLATHCPPLKRCSPPTRLPTQLPESKREDDRPRRHRAGDEDDFLNLPPRTGSHHDGQSDEQALQDEQQDEGEKIPHFFAFFTSSTDEPNGFGCLSIVSGWSLSTAVRTMPSVYSMYCPVTASKP